ncbi:OLC1v1038555C1 [Oldenlandia corymbosa var. corymbosa]|uniref:OLC1v1038555C1 n=1 Tax=Oldenlandia corymbosa var. corymbosa TaxID=529605 RepID=A0AAV1D0P3_OLDCO|nr:OLC1v1038555C1 [Oldenlandia corymbosa var. corymbosa]
MVSKLLDRCNSALRDIENPNLHDYPSLWDYEHQAEHFGFDFQEVFRPWLESQISAWPEGGIPQFFSPYIERGWRGVIVAVDHSVAGRDRIPLLSSVVHDLIQFNSRVIGCVTGEVDDCENLLSDLPQEVKSGTAADVSNWLVRTLSSRNVKGLSGLVIAGWDNTGPSLYRVDGEGKLHRGVLFAGGSCSEFGYGVVASCGSDESGVKVVKLVVLWRDQKVDDTDEEVADAIREAKAEPKRHNADTVAL